MPGEENKSASEELMETYMSDPNAEPTEPTELTEPVEPVDPNAEPTEPTEPVEPVDPNAEPTEPTEPDPEDLGLSDEEKATLKEATQAKLNARFAELTREKTDLETANAAAQERAEAAEREALALRTQLDSVGRGAVMQAAGIDPLLAAEHEGEIVQAEAHWRKVMRYTQRHVNSNLGENDAGQIIAVREKNQSGETVEYTQEQVAARLEQAEDMLDTTIPQARKLLQQRTATSAAVKEIYPELFKKDSAESKVLSSALRSIPGLNVLPNGPLLIGDMISGERLRSKDATEITVAGRTWILKDATSKAAPVKKVPKVPSKPAPAGPSPVASKAKGIAQFDQKAVADAEDPRTAALEQYKKIV